MWDVQVGIQVTEWDMAETKNGGPFPQLLEHEIVANCIYLMGPIPHFLTHAMLAQPGRALTVFTDISCGTATARRGATGGHSYIR
jgi:saccharopine dehydrogenase (NAD+, L-lysine-forming)